MNGYSPVNISNDIFKYIDIEVVVVYNENTLGGNLYCSYHPSLKRWRFLRLLGVVSNDSGQSFCNCFSFFNSLCSDEIINVSHDLFILDVFRLESESNFSTSSSRLYLNISSHIRNYLFTN